MLKQTGIKVKLVGQDGNAFAILGKVSNALKQAGHHDLAKEFMAEAMSGDYNHLLQTCTEVVEVV